MTSADVKRHPLYVAAMAATTALLGVGCLDSSGLGLVPRDASIDRAGDARAATDGGKGGIPGGDAGAKDGAVSAGGALGFGGLPSTGGILGLGGVPSRGGIPGSGGVPSAGGIVGAGGAPVAGMTGLGGQSTGGRSGSTGGAPGSGGRTAGGSGGAGGGAGAGGAAVDASVADASIDTSVDTRPVLSDSGVDVGGAVCGSRTCGANEYCCSPSCSLCTRIGSACLNIVCSADGGMTSDAGSCRATPSYDLRYCGGLRPPHAYVCTLSSLAAPCVMVRNGMLTDVYCCP